MIEAIRLTGQATPRNKVGFYLDYQNVCNGSAYAKGAEQCRDRGDDWVAIGSVGAGFFGALAPESGNVWDNREKITQFTWTSPVHEQAAARGRILAVRQPVRRTDPRRRADGLHPRAGTEHARWRAGRQLHLSRLVLRRLERAVPQRLACVGDLRHRCAQREDRLSGRVSGAEELPERRQPVELRLQQPNADSVHAARRTVLAEQPHALRRVLRAGSVDARPAHAAGRPAIRARVELVPRGRKRRRRGQPVRHRSSSSPNRTG